MRLRLLAVTLALAATAAACGDDEPARRTDPSPGTTTVGSAAPTTAPSADCAAAIPDAALVALGWTAGEPAGEHAGRCERQSGTSRVTVGSVGTGRASYDDRCAALAREDAPGPDVAPARLGDDVTACYRGFRSGHDTGAAALVLLAGEDRVVEIRLSAGEPTTGDQLEAGLSVLVDASGS